MGNTEVTHYETWCGGCNSNKIYEGYSKSSYDYYGKSTILCQSCNAEKSRKNRERAEQEAEEEAEEERIRIQNQKKRTKKLERQRLKRERIERQHQQQLAEERLKQEHQRELDEIEAMKVMKQIAKNEDALKTEAERIQKLTQTRKSKKKSNNPFLRFKSLDTMNTVKQIFERVETCSAVGEVIKQQHAQIATELIKSLDTEQYSVIKPEMDRYKKYGDQLSNMKNEFVKTFEDVFNDETDDIDDLCEAMQQDISSADAYMEEIKTNFESLKSAINTMETKLFLMEQYYDKIILDYEDFIKLCGSRKMENAGIPVYLKTLADGIKNRKRDVFEGDEFKQKTEFNVDYKMYQTAESKTDSTNWDQTATGAVVGAVVGGAVVGMAGAMIGGLVGGPAGALIGGIGGAVLGALGGAIIGAFFAHESRVEYHVEQFVSTKTYTHFTKKQTYDGTSQSDAIEKIIEALKDPLEKYANDLKAKQITANEELVKCDKLRFDVITLSTSLKEYKKELNNLMKMDPTPNQAKLMMNKWGQLKGKIQQSIETMQ